MGLKNVKTSLPIISKELERTNSSREFLIKNNREVIINCSQAIIAIHKNDLNSAKLKIKKAKMLLAKLKQKTTGGLNRYLLTPEQELVEAIALLSIIEGKQIPTYKSIKVSGESYILGLLDCIGELKRQIIDQIRIGNSKNAENLFEIMENLYLMLYPFATYDKIVKESRRKLDVNRILVEEARLVLTEEIRRQEFIKNIQNNTKNN
ncbi:MAG TPA: RNA-binding protein [Candidatus Nitrosopelagicus sp.]|jgi:translin|nr:RNA-binding protein [Candidatus Nitrosopelagicus sp.]